MAQRREDPGIFEGFIHSEVSGSMVMLACTVAALAVANSPWLEAYESLKNGYLGFVWGDFDFKMSLGHWINDGLMGVFFFVVGLEIKREISVGELSSRDRAILPVAAAAGGMLLPALIYFALNVGTPYAHGWGVPMATDIAFALGILALFGSRVPVGLKVFLTALAIADDLGAVLVIAVFYTEQIHIVGLLVAAGFLGAIVLMARLGVRQVWVYLGLGGLVWAGVLSSGIHATAAGVVLALLIPVKGRINPREFFDVMQAKLSELEAAGLTRESMISNEDQAEALDDIAVTSERMLPMGLVLEHALHPIQAFLILPLFAFFNAGVVLNPETLDAFPSLTSLGVIFGLALGKPVAVVGSAWILLRSGKASLPEGVTMRQILGAGCLAGVGFTMSIFITELAFAGDPMLYEIKLGVLVASLVSGTAGILVLRKAF